MPIIHKNNNISYVIKTKVIKGSVSSEKLDALKLSNK